MSGSLKRDENSVPVAGGVSSTDANAVLPMTIDAVTGRLKTDASGGATGTVTSVSVVSANGFAGSVANATTTPAITISTTITGIIKGDGTAISAASAATDYAAVAFKTIAVSGQSDVVADSPVDTLTLVGSGITITTNATTDTITFTAGAAGITVGTTVISSGTTTRVLYDNAGVLGEYVVSGSGNVAMTTSPVFTTPSLGAATATSINSLTITTSTGTLTITNLKTLSVSNTLTFTGTDGSSVAFGVGGTVLYTSSTIPLTIGTTTITSGTNTRILYNNSGVLGEYTVTGTGTTAVLSTSPTFTTSVIVPLIVGGTGTTGTQLTIKTTSGNGTTDAMVFVGGNNGATTFLTMSANVANFGTSAAITAGTIELGAASDTTLARSAAGQVTIEGVQIATISNSVTLTNKRMQPRTASSTTSSNLSPDLSTANVYYRTTQTATLTIDAPIGTPVIGETISIYVDSAGAQTLTINSAYKALGTAFPAATTAGKTFMMIAQYNGTDWKTTWATAV